MEQINNNCEPCNDSIDTATLCKEMKLWIIEYSTVNIGNGCAVVKAYNPKQAETLLKSQGIFNGSSYLYNITRIEEIVPSPAPMLICEQLATNKADLN